MVRSKIRERKKGCGETEPRPRPIGDLTRPALVRLNTLLVRSQFVTRRSLLMSNRSGYSRGLKSSISVDFILPSFR
jgi:hypothetical protein